MDYSVPYVDGVSSPSYIWLNSVYCQLQDNGVKQAVIDILMPCINASACVESANYTSNAFTSGYNATGYGYVAGNTYQIGSMLTSDDVGHLAKYASINDSACDYADYLCRSDRSVQLTFIKSLYDFCYFLKVNGYYTESLSDYFKSCSVYYDGSKNTIGTDSKLKDTFAGVVSTISNFTHSFIITLGVIILGVYCGYRYIKKKR